MLALQVVLEPLCHSTITLTVLFCAEVFLGAVFWRQCDLVKRCGLWAQTGFATSVQPSSAGVCVGFMCCSMASGPAFGLVAERPLLRLGGPDPAPAPGSGVLRLQTVEGRCALVMAQGLGLLPHLGECSFIWEMN